MARRQANGTIKIADRTLDLLCNLRCEKNVAFKVEEALDRKDYEAMNEALEALGGKWTRASKGFVGGHVFAPGVDAAQLIEAALLTGSVADPKAGDFFETPPAIAARMVALAGVKAGMRVLEPSAGDGRIARALAGAAMSEKAVHVVELNDVRRARLMESGYTVDHPGDFLEMKPPVNGFDAVVMNPPFSRQQDAAHVMHAFTFLRSGAKLVSVMSAGATFRTNKAGLAFQDFLKRHGAWEPLPDLSFAESGTNVRTGLVVLGR